MVTDSPLTLNASTQVIYSPLGITVFVSNKYIKQERNQKSRQSFCSTSQTSGQEDIRSFRQDCQRKEDQKSGFQEATFEVSKSE